MESKLPKFNAVKLLTYKNKGAIIGYGAYGKVRCCETLKSERVAVKYFPITGTPDEAKEKLSKIMNEAMLLHKLSHQHIIQLLGITQWEEYFGIVTEYLPGGNLDGFLKNEKLKEIPWPLRLRIASQLSDAITYLHQYKENKELIHGDVKPENVLLDKDLVVKLAYFGSVNMIIPSGATKTTTDLPTNKQHTLYYTAPEFLKDSEIPHTVKMDVYSFGMVLYEILTRMRIFENVKRPPDILVQVIIDMKQRPNLNQLEEINKNLSLSDEWIFENLQTHMKKCWSQLPNDRPSMQNVRDSLLILLNEISEESMKEVVKNATEALNMEVKKLDMNEATSLKSAVSSSDDVSSTSTVANSGFVEEISRKFPYTEISQIESLCGNPLQFLRMAYIPSSAYAFASMTRLFSALYDDLDASNPSEITNNLNSWPSLTKLGFSLTKMSEDDVRKFEFDQSVLHHIIKHQQTDTHELCKEKKKLHNIHEKMQAYLTAFHINNQKSDKEFEKFVDEELFSSRWNFVRRFLFGISFDLYRADASQQTKRKLMKEKFLKEISKCIGQHNLVELCCDAREFVENNIAKELAHRFPTSVLFYLDPLSYSDAHAISLVLRNVSKTLHRLELVGCKLNSQSFRFLAKAIRDMRGTINCLDINGNHLTSNDVHAICDILDKLNEELVMHQCFDDGKGGKRNASSEEMKIIENKWRSLQNPNLEVYFGGGYSLPSNDSY